MRHSLPRAATQRVTPLIAAVALAAIVASTLPSGISQLAAAAATDTDTVTVDTTTVAHTLSPTFFGVNYVGFWDSAQGSAASAQALAQTPIKTIRFAGGIPADWYDWADPYYQGWSSTSPLDLWHYAQQLGGRALFQTNYQGNGLPNPPGQSYAVNAPQNAAAWVTYDMTSGISADMEVGNEEDISMTTSNDPAFQPYITAFNANAQAMHAANPAVKVIGPAGTNEWYWWGLNSLGMFLQQTGNKIGSGQADGVSLHYYAGSGWSDTAGAAQQWAAPGGPWQFIQNTIAANDSRALPVYITEWNLGDSDTGTGFNQTLGHGLVVADMLGSFAQSGVAGEDYFAIHGAHSYGLLYGPGEAQPIDSPTPAYYATALWQHMGTQVLPLQQSADPASAVSTYATRSADGSYQVLAINKQASPQPIAVQFNGIDPTGHHLAIYSLTSSNASANVSDQSVVYNGATMPSPQQPLPGAQDGGTLANSTLSYTLPAYSAVVLAVDGGAPSPTMTPTPTVNPLYTATPTATSTPAPAVSATGNVSSQQVAPGQALMLTATIGVSGSALSNALVDLEVYDASSAKLCQPTFSPVTIAAGVAQTFAAQCAIPANATLGAAHFKIGVFGSNWSPLYTWNDNAATFTIATATTTPTNTPTQTNTPTATATNTATNTPVPPSSTPMPTAAIAISPTHASPFQTITMTGTNFGAHETVKVYWDAIRGTPLITPTTTASGAFLAAPSIPQTIAGPHALLAVGQTSHQTARVTIQVTPAVFLVPPSGVAGTVANLIGVGFGMSETVAGLWAPGLSVLNYASTNQLGTVAMTITAPARTPGTYVVIGYGVRSKLSAFAPFTESVRSLRRPAQASRSDHRHRTYMTAYATNNAMARLRYRERGTSPISWP